jgi:PPM family protein phosphatase
MTGNGQKKILVKTETLHAAGVSDPGRKRSENEDSIFLDENGTFVLLADGMGGHERGAEASQTAIEVIREFFSPEVVSAELADITDGGGIPSEISCFLSLADIAVRKANTVVYERNQQEGVRRFMGTTVVGLALAENCGHAFWFHVGDSRLYRMRNGQLDQLTVDHSAYNEWEKKGRNGVAPKKNIITRAVGPTPAVAASTGWEACNADDRYLLCSDGLSDMLSDIQIAEIIQAETDVEKAAARLIEAANDAGGKDNVSVILCQT